MVFDFVSHGGAIPFSSFLSRGNNKRSNNKRSNNKRSNNKRSNNKRSNNKRLSKRGKVNRRTNKRVDKRTNKRVDKRTNKRVDKRTGRRVNKRTERRTNKRTTKRTERRTDKRTNKKSNKKSRIQPLKTKCKCPKIMNKDSPDGLGLCAKCSPEGIVMKGKDGNLWESKGYHWEMIRKDMSGGRLS
jgi:hypothetical protein